MDQIRISGLKIFAHHGVYEKEKEQGQIFVVNAALFMDTEKAGGSDDLSDAVDYGAVCLFLDDFMRENTFDLLEAVAEHMAEALLLHFPAIQRAELEVEKPNAPIPLRFSSVSVKITRGWHKVYIALGSNLGDKLRYLENAAAHLQEDERFRALKVSDYIETKPYGGVEQDDFLNGVLEAETLYSPRGLLKRLQEEENAAGRKRGIRWGPRTLDLDILFYDRLIVQEEDLIIPHPDMQNRQFVLEPLTQLAPYYVHPVYQKSVRKLLEETRER